MKINVPRAVFLLINIALPNLSFAVDSPTDFLDIGAVKVELLEFNHENYDKNASELKAINTQILTLNNHFIHESGLDSESLIFSISDVNRKDKVLNFNFNFEKKPMSYTASLETPVTVVTQLQFNIQYVNEKFTVIDLNPKDEFALTISKVSKK